MFLLLLEPSQQLQLTDGSPSLEEQLPIARYFEFKLIDIIIVFDYKANHTL